MKMKREKIWLLAAIGVIVILNVLRLGVVSLGERNVWYFSDTMIPFINYRGYAVGSYSIPVNHGTVSFKTGCLLLVTEHRLWTLYLTDAKVSSYDIEILGNAIEDIEYMVFSQTRDVYWIQYKTDRNMNISGNSVLVRDIVAGPEHISLSTVDFALRALLKDNTVVYSQDGARDISIDYAEGVYKFTIPRGGYEHEYYFIRDNNGVTEQYNVITLNEHWDEFISGIRWEPRID